MPFIFSLIILRSSSKSFLSGDAIDNHSIFFWRAATCSSKSSICEIRDFIRIESYRLTKWNINNTWTIDIKRKELLLNANTFIIADVDMLWKLNLPSKFFIRRNSVKIWSNVSDNHIWLGYWYNTSILHKSKRIANKLCKKMQEKVQRRIIKPQFLKVSESFWRRNVFIYHSIEVENGRKLVDWKVELNYTTDK